MKQAIVTWFLWKPCTGDREPDIATDARFLATSILNLREALNGASFAENR